MSKMSTRTTMIVGVALMAVALVLNAGAALDGFVTIGDPGNDDQDSTNRDHNETEGDGYGGVGYEYQMSITAVSASEWTNMPNHDAISSDSDAPKTTGNLPTMRINLYEASAYANYLTSGSPTQGLYDITWEGTAGNSAATSWNSSPAGHDSPEMQSLVNTHDIVYALPTEDEWFKAAYYSVDDDQYYLYADGSDTAPTAGDSADDEWNYSYATTVRDVDRYGLEQNDTRNMMGNIWEWVEDREATTNGVLRGGRYASSANGIDSSSRNTSYSATEITSVTGGFRVVAIPEPASGMLLVLVGGLLWFVRRKVLRA